MEKKKTERQRLNKIVVGGLREAIRAHGPITKLLAGSAAKRIIGTLLARRNSISDHKEWLLGRLVAKITATDASLIFEGDIVMFRDCFFDNAELPSVFDWAGKEGFVVELTTKENKCESLRSDAK